MHSRMSRSAHFRRFAKCLTLESHASQDPARVYRALGHEARLQIAQALATDEHCVNDLRELVGSSWSTVSQHLAVLRNAGVVAGSKRGNQVVYRLAVPRVATFTSCLLARPHFISAAVDLVHALAHQQLDQDISLLACSSLPKNGRMFP